jgi:prepilin-type N-terminal cleavage/methylation domain-containing protein
MRSSSPPRIAARRGFTLVEVMLVVLIIGIVTSLAIPGFQKATARARRTEAMVALSKMQMYFVNLFENQGNFCPPDVTCAGSYTSVLNPTANVPVGLPAAWDPTLPGWVGMPFYPDGGVRLRYQFIANGTTLTLKAYGSFPGQASLGVIPGTSFDHSYEYTVTFQGTTLDSKNIVETPAF